MPCSHSCVTGVLTRPFLRGIFRRFLNGCANSSPLMYADGRHSLFICLEGPDAAGKDGTNTHLLRAMNPQGCSVAGFKVPSQEEVAHDFLWCSH